ncbi:MAG: phospholipase D-like domain-containing protein [Kiritimatiellaeota bacterium]|nr:phospholipase D-like domain-containing protein [Kiritimatiellota bacterium]
MTPGLSLPELLNAPLWHAFSVATALHLLAAVSVALHCLRRPREPRSLLLWLFVVLSFPFVGGLLYLMFGINNVPSKAWDKAVSDRRLDPGRPGPAPRPPRIYSEKAVPAANTALPAALQPLNSLLEHLYPDFPLLPGNRVTPLLEPPRALEAMLDAIRGARHHVHLQTYILGDDPVGRRFMALLEEKARAGVNVRVLFDAFGSARARARRLLALTGRAPNLRVIPFTQVNPLRRQFQVNLRNHRKILVVDGRSAFTGGVNLHNAYGPPASVRDAHFALSGPVVLQLQYTFLCDWFYMSGEPAPALLSPAHFPLPHAGGPAFARVLNAGSAEFPRRYEDALFALSAASARRLWIATPYFIPTDEMLRALRNAALRGIDVRVLVPGKNNHLYVQCASRASYAELLSAGARVFERNPPFTHAKLLLSDNAAVLFGSANLDTRSLRLNYETSCLAFDPALAAAIEGYFNAEFHDAREILPDAWQRRPLRQRMLENFCTLFNPVL